MEQGQDRVVKDDARASIAHDLADFFASIRFIAMYRTFSTGWLLPTERATIDALVCIVQQKLAIFTQ